MTGVIILAVGISGIQQIGGSFFVEPLFNGITLLVAIGIAGYAQRKRGAVGKTAVPGPVSGKPSKN
jgi:ribose transport system permease protein